MNYPLSFSQMAAPFPSTVAYLNLIRQIEAPRTLPILNPVFPPPYQETFLNLQYISNTYKAQCLLLSKQIQYQNLARFISERREKGLTLDSQITKKHTQLDREDSKTSQNSQTQASVEESIELKHNTKHVAISRAHLRPQIHKLVVAFLKEYGKNGLHKAEQSELKFDNPLMKTLYEQLAEKYSGASKCREDMVRFVLRKALTSFRNSFKDKNKLNTKAASLLLCQRYFKDQLDEMMEKKIQVEEALNFLLPYKKNSRNKTVNANFISEIFASEAFYHDYLEYLENFDQIMEADNNKKIAKFVDFIVTCVKDNALHRLKGFKRLPWLQVWLDSSKAIAVDLLNSNSWKKFSKPQSLKKEVSEKS